MRIPTDKVTLMLGICLIGLWFMVYGWWNDPSCQSLEDLHKPSGQEKWTMNRRNSCHGGVFEKDPCYVQSRIHPIDLIEWNGRIGCPPKTESLYYHPKRCAIEGEPLKMTIRLHCLITPQMGNSSWFPANYNANHRANFRSSVFRSPAPRVFNDDSDSSGAIWPHGGKKTTFPWTSGWKKTSHFNKYNFYTLNQ